MRVFPYKHGNSQWCTVGNILIPINLSISGRYIQMMQIILSYVTQWYFPNKCISFWLVNWNVANDFLPCSAVVSSTAFLIHVGMQQLLTYIEQKHYNVLKKVANVSFVWHPDTLFQPNDILFGTCFSCRKYRSTFIPKIIDRKSMLSSNHV